jgi:hypothetical protein
MRARHALSGPVVPGVIAGLIYLLIALATGASAIGSIVGGVAVAVITILVAFVIRAFLIRRAAARDVG